jgi:hypothetical protein
LRDHFTAAEKLLLKKFLAWGRRVNPFGEPTNPLLLLTSNELLSGPPHLIGMEEARGKPCEVYRIRSYGNPAGIRRRHATNLS